MKNDDDRRKAGADPGEGTMIRLAAAGLAALLMSCAAAFAEPRVALFSGSGRRASARCRRRAGRYGLVHRAASGRARHPRSEDRQGRADQARPKASPHGVIAGPDGAAWITETGQNAIVRVDPKSKEVKLFPLPKGFESANLNTATSTRAACSGSPARAAFMAASIRRAARSTRGRRRRATAPTASRRTPAGEVWYVSLAGDHSPARYRDRRRDRDRSAASRASGRAASGRTPRACCG